MKAMVIARHGGPDVIEQRDLSDPVAGPGEVLVEVAAAGVNFMDMGVRQSSDFWSEFPFPKVLGVEGAGRVLAFGHGVENFPHGTRVAWVYAPGSYAQQIVIPATSLVPVPDDVDDRTAAALMMQGLTASHFATDFYAVKPGDIALVHAAAGGLGLLLTQIIKLRGGSVIGRVSSEAKVQAAKEAGADHVVVDAGGDFADEVIALSGGEGVDVVYDGSGPDTFQASLNVLKHSGTFAWYGPVLGAPGALEIMSLPKSVKLGYAVFAHHVRTPALLRSRAEQLFRWVSSGQLKVRVDREYPLADAASAHAAMQSRSTIGKLLLIP